MVVTFPLGPTRRDQAKAKEPTVPALRAYPSLLLLPPPQASQEQWTVASPSEPRGPQETGSDRFKVSQLVLENIVHFGIL